MTPAAWATSRERGAVLWLRVMLFISLKVGATCGKLLLWPITAYFFLTSRGARQASRTYLERVLQRPVSAGEIFAHLSTFAAVALDRVFFLAGRTDAYRIDITGLDLLSDRLAKGEGCILMGAHVGSFEVLRALGRTCPVAVRPLMYREGSATLNRLMDELDPAMGREIIDIGAPSAMLKVSESLAAGEFVGILADRAPGGDKFMSLPFLGTPAPFPTGPIILAALARAPVILFSGVRVGPEHYHIVFRPFAERVELERGRRDDDLRGWLARYVGELERLVQAHPLNWFNFYDFWEGPSHEVGRA